MFLLFLFLFLDMLLLHIDNQISQLPGTGDSIDPCSKKLHELIWLSKSQSETFIILAVHGRFFHTWNDNQQSCSLVTAFASI
jgi:hypothetical protein